MIFYVRDQSTLDRAQLTARDGDTIVLALTSRVSFPIVAVSGVTYTSRTHWESMPRIRP